MDKQWSRVREVFEAACDLAPGEREAYLSATCASSTGLRAQVESLLAGADEAPTIFEVPAAESLRVLSETGHADPIKGCRLGSYQIIATIAAGGMGTVYLAERCDGQYLKKVAVKLITPGIPLSEALIDRFCNERQTLANLEHPNIARLLDGGVTAEGWPYLVMEYVEGQPIDQYCDENELDVEQRLTLFRAVASAVQYAHQNLVVHRDLKPGNILVTADGVPKLVDFGIARVLQPSTGIDSAITSHRVMTPEYASLEQIRGDAVTTGSDIYSLGVILYRLLTGQRPYRFKSRLLAEIERVIREEDPEKPSTAAARGRNTPVPGAQLAPTRRSITSHEHADKLRRRLAGDLDAIVMMAMNKDPSRRYPSVDQFSEDIRRHLEGLPVRARPTSLRCRAIKFFRRNIAASLAFAALAISLAGGLAGTIWQSGLAARQRDVALMAQEAAEQAANRTRTEALKAERINLFLNNMLSSIHPGQIRRVVTVRDMLADAADRIALELVDLPGVEASVRSTLGKTYHGLGMYQEAGDQLRSALKIRQRLLGDEHAEVADSLHDLATLCDDVGEYGRAEELLRSALAIRRNLFGREHAVVATTLNDLASMLHQHGDHKEAGDVAREAIPLFEKLLAAEDPGVMRTDVVGLAEYLHVTGQYAAAEALMRKALATHRRLLGDHALVARDLIGLAEFLSVMGAPQESEQLYRQALDIRRKLLGADHPEVADVLSGLAAMFLGTGEHERAESMYQDALTIRRRALGDHHPDVTQSIFDLGSLMDARGDFEAAESLKREALRLRRALQDGEKPSPLVSDSLVDLARFLYKMNDYSEAELLCREVLALHRQTDLGPLPIASQLYLLARILIDQGDPAQAEPLLREGLELRRRVMPDSHWTIAAGESALGKSLVLLGRFDEAEPLLLQSHRDLCVKFGASHKRVQETVERVVSLYDAWGRVDEAHRWREMQRAVARVPQDH